MNLTRFDGSGKLARKLSSAAALLLAILLATPSASFAQVYSAEAAAAGEASVSAGAAIRSIPSAPAALNPVLSVPALAAAPISAAAAPSALSAAAAPSAVTAAAIPALPVAAAAVSAPAADAANPAPADAADEIAAGPAAGPAATPVAAPSTEGLSPRSAGALAGAWRTVKALVQNVPDAPDSLAQAPLVADPNRVSHPSPSDWRDESFYFALLDRFARSGPGKPVGDPKDGGSRHGGNLRGVIEQLDYLKGAGVTTLMLSPVTQTLPEAYHGYAPVHLLAVDPHLGTMADMKELVAEAHKRGIKVVLDWVLNHAGPVFEYKEGSKWADMSKPAKEIGEWTQPMKPVELAQAENFTRRGVIDNWSDPQQAVNGDFPPNYRHYDSLNADTADKLVHIANWWIQETDIDGFRLDAVRHVPPAFLPVFARRVREYAKSIGKDNFFFVGENSTGKEDELKRFLEDGMLDSVFQYPAYRRNNKALHGAGPTWALEESSRQASITLGDAVGRLLRFIDNHDTYRFLRVGEPLEVLHLALGYVLLSIGIPILYAGTEQALRQGTDRLDPEGPAFPADPFNREDMFAGGQFKSESSAGDKFDPTSPTYAYVAKLNALRAQYPALRRGEEYPRWSDAEEAGLYAFSRVYERQEAVVAMNTASGKRGAEMWVDSGITPPGTELVDALDPSYRVVAHAADDGSKITIDVPPHGLRVLVRAAVKP